MASGVYWIRNRKNGKFYIGSSNCIAQRWREHRSFLRRNQHPNPHLQSSWNRYGQVAFEFAVIESVDEADLIEAEQWYLDNTRCLNRSFGYNASAVAGRPDNKGEKNPMFGKTHSSKTKQKMSVAHKARGVPASQYKAVQQLTLDGQVVGEFHHYSWQRKPSEQNKRARSQWRRQVRGRSMVVTDGDTYE